MESAFPYHNGIKLEINNRKIIRKSPNTWNLNSTLLIHRTKKKQENSKHIMKIQDIKNIWDTNKVVLRGKFIALNTYTRKRGKSSNLSSKLPPSELQNLEKEEQKKK